MKVSLSTLTLSILPCFAILAIQQAQAVPNPVAFVDEVRSENDLGQDNELPIDVQSATQSASTDTANPLDEHEPELYTTALENKTMLINCSALNQDIMRLACYDTLVHGETPAVIKTKQRKS